SFGLVVDNNTECLKDKNIDFENLPFEVLYEICKSLDGFSLNNLSLTCKRLRNVCSALLENRGLVVLQWEKKVSEEGSKWHIGYKRWFFSTCFTSVDKWIIDGNERVLNHLQSCAHFERVLKTEPFKLPHAVNTRESKKKL
ncbi:F-box only protein 30-like protein, partial [Leptotrombidium deliense]